MALLVPEESNPAICLEVFTFAQDPF